MTDGYAVQPVRVVLTAWAAVLRGGLLALGGGYLAWLGGSWSYLRAGAGLSR